MTAATQTNSEDFVERTACPCCGCPQSTELYRCKFTENPIKKYLIDFYSKQGGVEFAYFHDEYYDLRECNECSLVYQKIILGDKLMDLLYSKWIDPSFTLTHIETGYDVSYYLNYTKMIYKIITLFNRKPNELNFLDFGMGWGNWARIAAAFNVNSYGMELSEDRIEHARKFGVKVIGLNTVEENKFDYINTDQVFEHLPNPWQIIEKLALSLKSGGILRICVPDGNSIKEKLAIMDWTCEKGHPNSLNVVAPLEHINCYTTKSIVHMAERAGLKWYYLNYYPQVELIKTPISLGDKLKSAAKLPSDVIKYIGGSVKRKMGIKYTPSPYGSNLFFIKP